MPSEKIYGVSCCASSYNKPEMSANHAYSCFLNEHEFPIEVLIIENGDSKHAEKFWSLIEKYGLKDKPISYFTDKGNRGFSGTANTLWGISKYEYFLYANEDMAYAPHAIDLLLKGLKENPSVGCVCSNLIDNLPYDRTNPKLEDIIDFSKRYYGGKEEQMNIVNASNPPMMFHTKFIEILSKFDVFDPPFEGNKALGPFSEDIDYQLVGWFADWDAWNRTIALGKDVRVISNSYAMHYGHSTGSEFDSKNPGWTRYAEANYFARYGCLDKNAKFSKRQKPEWYPARP